jgi:hypothetical protein
MRPGIWTLACFAGKIYHPRRRVELAPCDTWTMDRYPTSLSFFWLVCSKVFCARLFAALYPRRQARPRRPLPVPALTRTRRTRTRTPNVVHQIDFEREPRP